MEVRKATFSDYEKILEIYGIAQDFMIRTGNPDQWGHVYPEPALVRSDIENGICHVLCEDDVVHGVFALLQGPDPTYRIIEDGEWLNDDPYVVIHRIAGDGQVHGIFQCAADYSKQTSSNVRVDTHRNNAVMQKQTEKSGFRKCGTIYVEDGSPRIAYHWVKA